MYFVAVGGEVFDGEGAPAFIAVAVAAAAFFVFLLLLVVVVMLGTASAVVGTMVVETEPVNGFVAEDAADVTGTGTFLLLGCDSVSVCNN
jgi:hypothetical protein